MAAWKLAQAFEKVYAEGVGLHTAVSHSGGCGRAVDEMDGNPEVIFEVQCVNVAY